MTAAVGRLKKDLAEVASDDGWTEGPNLEWNGGGWGCD